MTAIPIRKSIPVVDGNQDPETTSPETRKRFRRRVVTFLGMLLVAMLVFAPLFVAKTSLRHRILPMLLPEYPAKITTGDASLLWWASVELKDVQFHDLDGEPMLHVEKITSEKSLMALVADQIRVGGFHIENPHLKIRLKEAGSNLEETIAPLFAPKENAAGLDCAFQVRNGVIEIENANATRQSELRNVQADLRLPLDPAEAITVRGAAEVQNAGVNAKAGSLDFDVTYRWLADANNKPNGEAGTLRLKTSDLRLEALSALYSRIQKNLDITGVVVSDLAAEWTTGNPDSRFKLNGGLNTTNFSLRAPAWLGDDTFRLEYLTHQGQLEYRAGEMHLEEVALKSDVLTCQATGVLNVPQLLNVWNTPATEIPSEEFHLTGEVNLARIAKLLPQTLRLREGMEIRTGTVQIALDTTTQNAEQLLAGKINTSRIAAMADGREIVWEKPLELTLKARNTRGGPVLDELACRADFLSLWAQGTPENATFKAACKLDELMKELNRFANLEPWQLAGRIDAGLTLRRLNPELLRGAASAVVKNFRFSKKNQAPDSAWEETQLTLAAGGDLVSAPNQAKQLQNLSVRVNSGADELQVTQTEPVIWTNELPDLSMVAELKGELASWQNRLRPFVPTDGWQMKGNITATATATAKLSKTRITLEQAIADVQNLGFQTAGIHISEPRAHIETKADWSRETGKLLLPVTTWASSSLSLRADEVEYFTSSEGTPRTSGRVVFRGGVGELSRWFAVDQMLGEGKTLAGVAAGQMELTMTNQAADARWNIAIQNAALTQKTPQQPLSETLWAEDRITFRGGGMYDFGQDDLQLQSTLLETAWLTATVNGSLRQASTKGDANLAGTLTCNMPLLAERFRSTLGSSFQIAGNETRAFSVRGPLWAAQPNQRVANELTAFVSVPWQQINAYGIPVGPAELKTDLNLGTVQFGPLDASLGTGRLKLKSQLALNAPVLALQIEKGPVLENIKLTPEISREWIKYAVPLLGDSTETDGQFSAFLTTDGIIPLENPSTMNVSGIVAIESAQMRPGKLAKTLLDVTRQVKSLVRGQAAGGVLADDQTLIRLDKQTVNVQSANGRVYHQNLKMVLTDIPITTSGSVGFDETLSITAEIPIQADWLKQNRMLAGLKGQTLKIPIGGTLSQPVADTRAVFSALQNAAQNATGRVIEDELQNQFNRLFKR